VDLNLGHAVAVFKRQPLTNVDVGQQHPAFHELDNRSGDIAFRRRLDPFEARRGVHLHDDGSFRALEHVDAGHVQAHDLGGPNRGALVQRVQRNRFHRAPAMHVAAKLVPHRHPPHGAHHMAAYDESADVPALALFDEFLNEHVLLGALKRFDDGFRRLVRFGQDHPDPLRTLQQFDDDRRATHRLDGRQHGFPLPDKGGDRDADVVPAQHLHGPELVAGNRDTLRGVHAKNAHLLELPDHRGSEKSQGCADARDDGVVVGRRLVPVRQRGPGFRHVNGKLRRVQYLHRVAALLGGLLQAAGAVQLRVGRKDGYVHVFTFLRFRGGGLPST